MEVQSTSVLCRMFRKGLVTGVREHRPTEAAGWAYERFTSNRTDEGIGILSLHNRRVGFYAVVSPDLVPMSLWVYKVQFSLVLGGVFIHPFFDFLVAMRLLRAAGVHALVNPLSCRNG